MDGKTVNKRVVNKEQARVWNSRYYAKVKDNPEFIAKNRKRASEGMKRTGYFKRLRAAALAVLGGKCVKCGFADIRALQIDHINGGGSKERKVYTSNFSLRVIRSVAAGENLYQLLCANCNWIKRYENNELKR